MVCTYQTGLEKAKKDKETLGTDYFILVSRNLPKKSLRDKDGLYGDGILLASPDIIVAIAGIIRKAIIEISKNSVSKQDRETKQTKLYDYARSRDFYRQVESICIASEKMSKLQDDEEKSHNTLWNKREALQKILDNNHNESTVLSYASIFETLWLSSKNVPIA